MGAGRGLLYALKGLAGAGEGILAGQDLQRKQQQQGLENLYKQKQFEQMANNAQFEQAAKVANMGEQGQVYDPNAKAFTVAPWKQAAMAHEQEKADPNSEFNKNTIGGYKATANKLVPGIGDTIPQGMNAADTAEYMKTVDPLLKANQSSLDRRALYGLRAQQGQDRMDFSKNTQMEKQANQIHSKVVQKIQSDPNLNQRFNQYTNLSNALSNFEAADHATPQAFDELQQAVRANLGIKGGSGIGERELTQMNSLGLNAERMKQFLTGNPADIAKNGPLVQHLTNLVKLEQQNINGQVGKQLNSLSAGHGSMYKKFPELKADLEDAVSQRGNMFAPIGQQPAAAPSVDPGLQAELRRRGLVK